MDSCCRSGNHESFYRLLKEYGVEKGTDEYVKAVAALLEHCRQLKSL